MSISYILKAISLFAANCLAQKLLLPGPKWTFTLRADFLSESWTTFLSTIFQKGNRPQHRRLVCLFFIGDVWFFLGLICCCERVPIFVGATPTTFNWHPTTFFVLLLFCCPDTHISFEMLFLLLSRFSWKSLHLFGGVSFAVAFDITRRIWNNCSPILFFLNLKLVPKQMDQKSWKNHFQKWITTSETRNSICCLRNTTWHSGWNFEYVISNKVCISIVKYEQGNNVYNL